MDKKVELVMDANEIQGLKTRLSRFSSMTEAFTYINDLINKGKYADALNAIEELESQTEA